MTGIQVWIGSFVKTPISPQIQTPVGEIPVAEAVMAYPRISLSPPPLSRPRPASARIRGPSWTRPGPSLAKAAAVKAVSIVLSCLEYRNRS